MRTPAPTRPLHLRAGVPGTAGLRDESLEPEESLAALRDAAAKHPNAELIFDRGDCLHRTDFPQLFALARQRSPRVGLATTGVALRSTPVLDLWGRAGGPEARVTVFSGVAAAHDWVAGAPGEARRILRGVRAGVEAGIPVHVEIPLVRPAMQSLTETVQVLAALGVGSVAFRMLRLEHVAPERRLALGARVGLLAGPLGAAAAEALRRGLRLELSGLPTCVLPASLRPYALDEGGGCAVCGGSRCIGLSPSYEATFGSLELRPSPRGEATEFALSWSPSESRREVRRRLVRALEHRAGTLRVTGPAMGHPDAPELLREAVRSAPAVELVADLAPLLRWSDDELHRVRKLSRVQSTVPSVEATQALQRLAEFGVST